MYQFLCGIDFYRDKCVMAPKTDWSLNYNVLSSLLIYFILKLSPSSFLLLSCVEDSHENFARHSLPVQKRVLCAPENVLDYFFKGK